MRIIVSDSSCLIDLRKAVLLDAFLGLPFEVLIPDTLFEDELLKFTPAQKKGLLNAGLKVVDMPGPGVLRAREIMMENRNFSIHDGLAYVLAEGNKGCILLTGDKRMRELAVANSIAVHGVLWVVDEIHRNGHSPDGCHKALTTLSADPTVRLPTKELNAAIKRFAALCKG